MLRQISLVFVFLLSPALLFGQPLSPSARAANATATLRAPARPWAQHVFYGVYMMGRKVGYAETWRGFGRGQRPGLWKVSEAFSLEVGAGAARNTMKVQEQHYFSYAFPYRLIEARYRLETKEFVEEKQLVWDSGQLKLQRRVDGGPWGEAQDVVSRETFLAVLAQHPSTAEPEQFGRETEWDLWQWEGGRDERVAITLKGVESRTIHGVSQDLIRQELYFPDSRMRLEAKIIRGGVIAEMAMGMGIVWRLEEESQAKAEIAGMDILSAGIESPKALGNLSAVNRAELIVTTPKDFLMPTSAYQTTELLDEVGEQKRWKIVITREPQHEVTPEEARRYLAADEVMDSDHPAIIALGQELAADTWEEIPRWVYRHLDKQLATHTANASSLLKTRSGDCTEHTWLTVALLRAVGIPARPVYGVAYLGDGERRFGYHAWVELALPVDGKEGLFWHAIDPMWNQRVSDVGHLVLGYELREIGGVVGGGLEVVHITL